MKLACVIAVHCCLSLALAAFVVGQLKDVDFTLPRRMATPFLFSTDSTGVSIAYYKSWHNMPSTAVYRSASEQHWASIFKSPSSNNWDNGVFAYRDHVSIQIPAHTLRGRRTFPRVAGPRTAFKQWPRRFGVYHWCALTTCSLLFASLHRSTLCTAVRWLFDRKAPKDNT